MNKSILIAATILMSAWVSLAQETRTDGTTKSPSHSDSSSVKQSKSQNYSKDMTKMTSSEVPATLKKTLGGSQYKGWEQGTVYRSKNGDAYVVEITTNGKKQVHHFSGDGKAAKPDLH